PNQNFARYAALIGKGADWQFDVFTFVAGTKVGKDKCIRGRILGNPELRSLLDKAEVADCVLFGHQIAEGDRVIIGTPFDGQLAAHATGLSKVNPKRGVVIAHLAGFSGYERISVVLTCGRATCNLYILPEG